VAERHDTGSAGILPASFRARSIRDEPCEGNRSCSHAPRVPNSLELSHSLGV